MALTLWNDLSHISLRSIINIDTIFLKYKHPDDTEEAIMKRLSAYQIFVDDICEFYEDTVKHINADQDPHTIFESLEAGIVSPLPIRPDTPF